MCRAKGKLQGVQVLEVSPRSLVLRPSSQLMKIEKNIPVTPRCAWRFKNGHASVVHEMEVGDSVLCQTQQELFGIRNAIYRTGHKPVSRVQPDGTHRVWKIK